ncbi:MAG: zinc-dependent alcohol dehydrogenase family protein [Pseudomonadota bacterium]
MHAMVLNSYGSDAPFESTDLPKPEVLPGHVRVKIAATSVNTVDTMIRRLGQAELPLSPDLPALLGMDFAGTVDEVGPGVSEFSPGDEVYGCAGGLADLPGALAQFMVADVRLLARKPPSLSMREAAALPLVGITAYEGLMRAQVQPDQSVLVHGGAGGVGHVALQLARHFGAQVYATGGGDASLEVIAGYGATAIDYKRESVAEYVETHTAGRGFEIVYDSVGGPNMNSSFEAAALNAQVVTTVSMLELDLTPAHFKGLSIHVVFMLIPMLHDVGRQTHGEVLSRLAEIVERGGLRPLVDEARFSLEEVGLAHERLLSGQAVGKVVIDVA